MVIDPLAQQVGIGGSVAVVLVATVMKFLPAFMRALREQKNGHELRDTAGSKSVEEWEGRFSKLMHDANEEQMVDIRNMMDMRNEKIREIIRAEIRLEWERRRLGR